MEALTIAEKKKKKKCLIVSDYTSEGIAVSYLYLRGLKNLLYYVIHHSVMVNLRGLNLSFIKAKSS
jgi:hypothetical protein